MIKIRAQIRSFLCISIFFALFIGAMLHLEMLYDSYESHGEWEQIYRAKQIKPFYNSEASLQDGLLSFFGKTGEWQVDGDRIHVVVMRDFSSMLPGFMEFDVLLGSGLDEGGHMVAGDGWAIENLCVDFEDKSEEETYYIFNMIFIAELDKSELMQGF